MSIRIRLHPNDDTDYLDVYFDAGNWHFCHRENHEILARGQKTSLDRLTLNGRFSISAAIDAGGGFLSLQKKLEYLHVSKKHSEPWIETIIYGSDSPHVRRDPC
jgi:hypothetical protein